MKAIAAIGLDIAKQVFQLYGADKVGQTVFREKLRRSEIIRFFSEQPARLKYDIGFHFPTATALAN